MKQEMIGKKCLINLMDNLKKINPLYYYRIVGPIAHRNLLGFTRPCNIFELMHLVGSEKDDPNFEKADYDRSFISFIPLKRLASSKLILTEDMSLNYPWIKLSESIRDNGVKIPIIANDIGHYRYIPIEGRHRIGASTLVFDFEFKIPSVIVKVDKFYTFKMYKKPHPYPLSEEGFRKFNKK